MGINQLAKGKIVSIRIVFEPNRFEQASIEAAYKRVVPIVRYATSHIAKTGRDTSSAFSSERRKA
jgi:hypothetical protein